MKYSIYKPVLKLIGFIVTFSGGLNACKKYITVDPPYTQVAIENLFTSTDGAMAALHGVYNAFATPDGFATDQFASVALMSGLCSDELSGLAYSSGGDPYSFYTNSLQPTNGTIRQLWTKPYNIIYMCNAILEGLQKSGSLSDSVKNQVEGETKFMRAFLHFYLVNLYGNIPLVTSTDWKINATMPQSDPSAVYNQIIQDLEEAKALVSVDYPRSAERLYVNKGVVSMFLSRVYLYVKNWGKAEEEATAVIDNGNYHLENDLNNVFVINSQEIIWQLKPIEAFGTNTQEGQLFILQNDPSDAPFLTNDLLSSFETQDRRKIQWTNSFTNGTTWYFPFKYKLNSAEPTTSEYSVVMRLGEVYLIRAEARAQQNKIQGTNSAAEDIDAIRIRAGLDHVNAPTQQAMLDAIYHERQVELFTEWGHRWFDLKRWGLSNDIFSGVKGSNWQITDTIYPIPQIQITNNPATVQNPGYE